MVGGHIRALEDRGDLELTGRHLVVAGLRRDAQLEQLVLALHHAGQHALGDGPEVVVIELLALGWLGTEQRPAGADQVWPSEEERPIDQEVLLLGPGEGDHRRGILVSEQSQDAVGLGGHGLL